MRKRYGKPIDMYDVLSYMTWGILIIFAIVDVALIANLSATKLNLAIIIGVAVIGIITFFIMLIISKMVCNRLIELELRIEELEKENKKEN